MKVALASDHAGFPLKEALKDTISNAGHSFIDLGTNSMESVDYPDYAFKLAKTLNKGEAERGILICGSGVGASIAANKIKGIYAAICHDTYSAHQGVEHDKMNVLCLGGRIIGPELANEIVLAFLGAIFSSEERHNRRVAKFQQFEEEFNKV
jgi:ribose 5-phosphate isomerase B